MDQCLRCANVIFEKSWCSQERCIRFTTPQMRKLLPPVDINGGGKWGTGDFLMYEVENAPDSFVVKCVLSAKGLPIGLRNDVKDILAACGISYVKLDEEIVLKSWNLTEYLADVNVLCEKFAELQAVEILQFEKTLADGSELMTEGNLIKIISRKYERNQ